MFIRTVFLAAFFLFAACGQDNPAETAEKAGAESSAPAADSISSNSDMAVKTVVLSGESLEEDASGSPRTLVLLTVDGKSQIIDTVATCEAIAAGDYSNYEIPMDAASACGGWWAGSGDYFYATIRKGKVIIYEGWQDEQQEDRGFHWKVKKIG